MRCLCFTEGLPTRQLCLICLQCTEIIMVHIGSPSDIKQKLQPLFEVSKRAAQVYTVCHVCRVNLHHSLVSVKPDVSIHASR